MSREPAIGAVLLISAFVAGCAPRGAATTPTPPAQAGQESVVQVTLREFEFEPRPLRVKAGTVRFRLVNRGAVEHDFAIPSLEGHGDHEQHLVRPGQSRDVELDLKPGTYEAVCTIPGHKEAGMVVQVEVSE